MLWLRKVRDTLGALRNLSGKLQKLIGILWNTLEELYSIIRTDRQNDRQTDNTFARLGLLSKQKITLN